MINWKKQHPLLVTGVDADSVTHGYLDWTEFHQSSLHKPQVCDMCTRQPELPLLPSTSRSEVEQNATVCSMTGNRHVTPLTPPPCVSPAQAPTLYAPLPSAVCGPVAPHQQEVPHLQGGH